MDETSLDAIRLLFRDLPGPDRAAAEAVALRQAQLTKPPGSLGRLETLAAWLAAWQGRAMPRLEHKRTLVFAGNHGVAARGVSAYPAAVTAQMVANFRAGGAAVNQLVRAVGGELRVVEFDLDQPTGDITTGPAMTDADCAAAIRAGMSAVGPGLDVVALGEMGIGNSTAAAALCHALFGEAAGVWVGAGTGLDAAGMARKAEAVAKAVAVNRAEITDPFAALRCVGGFELAAIVGAVIAARRARVPVLLDGFICTAAAAVLYAADPGALDHCVVAHRSAEAGHRRLLDRIGQEPLLDLGMRLGEASGATLAIAVLQAAIACHGGMATFADAGVTDRDD